MPNLDRLITFQSFTTSANSVTADDAPVWASLISVHAAYTELRGRELFAAQQINATITASFTIRHRTDISPKQRIVFGSGTFDIQSVREVGSIRTHWLEILASTRD